MSASKVNRRFVVGASESLSVAMLWVGSAMAEDWCQIIRAYWQGGGYIHLALNDVSTTLLGVCFPFPSFSLAFCGAGRQTMSSRPKIHPTEKSAALSFFFLLLFGIFTHDFLYW